MASFDVKSFRHRLLAVHCTLAQQVNDSELESWLFRPGPNRLRLLQWCMCKVDPDLQLSFQNCNENDLEKGIVESAKSIGITHKRDAILGSTTLKKPQYDMWNRMAFLLEVAEHLKSVSSPELKSPQLPVTDVINTLLKNKDFKELLHIKINLIPMQLHVSRTMDSKKKLEQQLAAVQIELEELQKSVNDLSLDDIEDTKPVLSKDEYRSAFEEQFERIKECYNHLASTVFPAVKYQPECPEMDLMGDIVSNLAHKITGFVQMLKDTEKIKEISDKLGRNNSPAFNYLNKSVVEDNISKAHSMITEVVSLMRLHNMV